MSVFLASGGLPHHRSGARCGRRPARWPLLSSQVEIIFFSTPTPRRAPAGPQRHCRRVLEGEPCRVEDGDAAVGGGLELPATTRSISPGNVVLRDHTIPEGNADLHIHRDAAATEDVRVARPWTSLSIAFLVRSHGGWWWRWRSNRSRRSVPSVGVTVTTTSAPRTISSRLQTPDLEAVVLWLLTMHEVVVESLPSGSRRARLPTGRPRWKLRGSLRPCSRRRRWRELCCPGAPGASAETAAAAPVRITVW